MATNDEKTFEHPAYGLARFTRTMGTSARLFGSNLPEHYNTIRFTVQEGVRLHDLGNDRYHAKKRIIEIEMSAAQFAELITAMNMGAGVPCTIRFRERDGHIEGVPEVPNEREQTRLTFKQEMEEFGGKVRKRIARIEEKIAKLSKKAQEEIRKELGMVVQEIEFNIPFALDSFQENVTKLEAESKAEVDAFVTNSLVSLGLETMKDRVLKAPEKLEPRQLRSSSVVEEEDA